MQFVTLLAFALASISLSSAATIAADSANTPVDANAYLANDGIVKRSGCGSSGPLGTGHYRWYIDAGCTPGDT